jgi:DNA-binding NtrC family response regulator
MEAQETGTWGEEPIQRHPTTLVIDDEPAIRGFVRRALELKPELCRVVEAGDGAQGLDIIQRGIPRVSLVLTDFRMPSIGGREVIQVLQLHLPDLPVICMTGYSSGGTAVAQEYGIPILIKPFSAGVLRAVVRDALDGLWLRERSLKLQEEHLNMRKRTETMLISGQETRPDSEHMRQAAAIRPVETDLVAVARALNAGSPRVPPPSIFVIDDEALVRQATVEMLRYAGYPTMELPDAESALMLLDNRLFSCSLVITDVRMPEMSGVELAEELAARRPELPVLVVSAFPEPEMTPPAGVARRNFLAKPYVAEQLFQAISGLLWRYSQSPLTPVGAPI